MGLTGLRIPEPERIVRRGRSKPPTVGRPSHTIDRARVPFECLEGLTGLRIPEPERIVIRGRSKPSGDQAAQYITPRSPASVWRKVKAGWGAFDSGCVLMV